MQSQGSGGVPESRYTMSYGHGGLTGDSGADLYGHSSDSYVNVLQHPHQHLGHGGPGLSPTGSHHSHSLGLGHSHSPPQHQHPSKRSADAAGLNLKQDPMIGDVMSMGHRDLSSLDEVGPSSGQNGSQNKKTPPPNGKKTKGRVKIKMEFIDNKLRRYTTFSKRKTGIMKKAYELSTLTGTQVMLLVASETGHVYTFATRKLQPMITSEAGKALIQTCLNSPDPPSSTVDQRMSATGFEETELTYTLHDEDQKDSGSGEEDDAVSSDGSRSPSPAEMERSYSSEGSTEAAHRSSASSAKEVKTNEASGRDGSDSSTATVGHHQQHQQQQFQLVINGRASTNTCSGPPAPSGVAANFNATLAAGLANLNLPGLSGLPLAHGANLASLLASASLPGLSLLTSGGGTGGSCSQNSHLGNNKESAAAAAAAIMRKNLPQLISLAHLGAGVQAAAGSGGGGAKDANHQLRNLAAHSSSSTSSPSSALNLQTKEAKRGRAAGGGRRKK